MRTNTITIMALAVLGIAGCGGKDNSQATKNSEPISKAVVEKGKESVLLPATKGTEWTYSIETSVRTANGTDSKTADLTYSVAKVTPAADGSKIDIQVKQNGKTEQTQTWLLTSKGIFQSRLGKNSTPYSPPQPSIVFPVEDGKRFSWKGTGLMAVGVPGTGKYEYTIEGAQEVDTDMGRMSAFCVSCESDFTAGNLKGKSIESTWWAPNVGLVRQRLEIAAEGTQDGKKLAVHAVQVMRLKTYKPAK